MAGRYRRFEQEKFILTEECDDIFDAHDAAHVYRVHENLKCRIIPDKATGSFLIYVGPSRVVQAICKLRWCPHNPGGPKFGDFFSPRAIPPQG